LYNGHISIRNSKGEEQVRIERANSPIWSLNWCISQELDCNILAVADWSQRLSFFQATGKQIGKDKLLDYDPCSINYFGAGEYIILGGSDKEVTLWTGEGIKIGSVCKTDGWVWSCRAKPNQPYIAVGSADGMVSVYQIQFNPVQTMYREKYAFRQNMTDIIIQDLTTNQSSKIKCRTHVKKISLYQDILAVQTNSRIFIYEMILGEAELAHYRLKEKFNITGDFTIITATSTKLLMSIHTKLKLFSFEGEVEYEWNFESPIRYIKAIGGTKGKDCFLVGHRNGDIIKLFTNNHFPIPIISHKHPIICFDLNLTKEKLAVVDESFTLFVYHIETKELLFKEENANSVAWNLENEHCLSYTGNGLLSVKNGSFAAHQQKFHGFVVGFKGSTVFCLQGYQIVQIDIPQTIPLDGYMDKGNYQMAYSVACLGIPDSDWRRLAINSLQSLNLEIAERAYLRVRDFKHLEALRHISKLKTDEKKDNDVLMAEMSASIGNFSQVRHHSLIRQQNYSSKVEMFKKR
jgi:intraflagellar transport protein 122